MLPKASNSQYDKKAIYFPEYIISECTFTFGESFTVAQKPKSQRVYLIQIIMCKREPFA